MSAIQQAILAFLPISVATSYVYAFGGYSGSYLTVNDRFDTA